MLAYLVRRLLWAIPIVWLTITVSFLALNKAYDERLSVQIERSSEQDGRPEVSPRQVFGSGAPLHVRYTRFLGNAARFDWGDSVSYNGLPVRRVISSSFPVSARIGALAFLIAVLLGALLGTLAAARRDSWVDRFIVAGATLSYTLPSMVLAVLLLMLVAIRIPWFPFLWGLFPVLWDYSWKSYVLPSLVLGLGSGGYLARLTRASVLEVLGQDYVRTARAKGLRERNIIRRHVLKNALPTVVAALGPTLATVLAGSLLVEYIFGIPGAGRLVLDGFAQRDYPLILAGVTLYTLLVVLANLAADIAYGLLDPRLKLGSP